MSKIKNGSQGTIVAVAKNQGTAKAKAKANNQGGSSSPRVNEAIRGVTKAAAAVGGAGAVAVAGTFAYWAYDAGLLADAGLVFGATLAGSVAGDFGYALLNHAPGEKYTILGKEIDLDATLAKGKDYLKNPSHAVLTGAVATGLLVAAASVAPISTLMFGVSALVTYGIAAHENQPTPTPTPTP